MMSSDWTMDDGLASFYVTHQMVLLRLRNGLGWPLMAQIRELGRVDPDIACGFIADMGHLVGCESGRTPDKRRANPPER